jgi:hypothetical protein
MKKAMKSLALAIPLVIFMFMPAGATGVNDQCCIHAKKPGLPVAPSPPLCNNVTTEWQDAECIDSAGDKCNVEPLPAAIQKDTFNKGWIYKVIRIKNEPFCQRQGTENIPLKVPLMRCVAGSTICPKQK